MKIDLTPFEDRLKKHIVNYRASLDSIRTGRASASVLHGIMVDYYGTPTEIGMMAEVKVTDARTLTITPWDASTVKSIEKAILASDIGITPQNDGKVIRLGFPQPTEESRRELTKQVSKQGEEAKVGVRNIRHDIMDKIKDMKKNGEMTEDEQKQSEKLAQDLTDKYVKEVDGVTEAKSAEIMEF